MPLPIEDHALVGDRRTAALVGRDGAVPWLCLPRFDSPACFASLLGTPEHGEWRLEPIGDYEASRRYLGRSSVLETTFTTADGVVRLLDVMPRGDGRADLVRTLVGVEGSVRLRHVWRVRFDYGSVVPWVRRVDADGEPVITAVAGPDQLVLRGPRLPHPSDHSHTDELEIGAGESATWATVWLPSHVTPHDLGPLRDMVAETIAADEAWLAHAEVDAVPHRDLVVRSLLTLRLMTHEETGGVVAAPTTSLPEDVGGSRNWDYRYCWLRDAALTLSSLLAAGLTEEAGLWRDWLVRTVAGDPQDLQVLYAVDGARRLPEIELDHLPGYADSRPVRVGNGAVTQRQLDVLGEVMDALDRMRCAEDGVDPNAWSVQRALVDDLVHHWDEPDEGIWEIRGEPRHFVHSRVMVWVAFDRAVRAVEQHGVDGDVQTWRRLRDEVHAEVLERGYDAERGTFRQHYETDEVDASLLVLPLVGFLPGDDPRVQGTIRAVEEDLLRGGLVLRYRTGSGVDGLEGDENPFLACSFWLASAYAVSGRRADGVALLDRLAGLANDVGLYAEELDPGTGRMLGNFPQALTHLALVQAAFHLSDA